MSNKKKKDSTSGVEVNPPEINPSDTMWRVRAEETSEKSSSLFSTIFGSKKKEGKEAKKESYTSADLKKAIEKGDMIEATHAVEYLINEARKIGEWWQVEDFYNTLIKKFPETLPSEELCTTMFAYGISRGKLKIAETALRQLVRRNPRHELIKKRLPAFIELCIDEKEVRKAAYWLDRYRQQGGEYKVMVELNERIRELDPSQAFADEWLKQGARANTSTMRAVKQESLRDREDTPVVAGPKAAATKPKAASKVSAKEPPKQMRPPGVKTYSTLILDGRMDDALRVLASCTTKPPEDSHPIDHIRLAEQLVRSRRYSDALKVLAKVPMWHPDQPEAPQSFYIAAWIMNEVFHATDKAIKALDTIMERYPGSVFAVKAKNYKAKILSSSGN